VSRIIGGIAGGRRLTMPAGRDTRPTSDRVREALFSTLAADLVRGAGPDDGSGAVDASTETPAVPLAGIRFLDLFAGSGAVGLEAASRGAGGVDLVERSAVALRAVRRNVESLGLAAIRVHAVSVERFLAATPDQPYDVVFLDPPYADDVTSPLVALVDNRWLDADGIVVVERATRGDGVRWPEGLVGRKSRRYGEATLCYGSRS
jgi:16S rRNA (guanine966-N2)-methyltransferase